MKRIIALALLVLMIACLAASCKDDPKDASSSVSGNNETDYWQQHDLGIKHFVIQTAGGGESGIHRFVSAEFTTNDEAKSGVINDAIVKRTDYLEEKYGITIEVEQSIASDRMEQLLQTIRSGDNEFHVIANSTLSMATFMNEGAIHDLRQISTIDLERDYYDHTIIDDLSIGNALYFISSDAILSDKMATWAMYYNKNLINEYNLEQPYELVRNNEWTIDKMHEMARAVSDYNQGISNPTIENGRFGYIGQTYDGLMFMEGFGQKMFAKDESDLPIADYENNITYTKFAAVYDLLRDPATSIIAEIGMTGDIYKDMRKGFYEGRGLFHADSVAVAFDVAEEAPSNFSFGVLPMPKYDSTQENYYTSATTYWALVMAIPNNWSEKEAEDIGFFIDVLSYYGNEYVIPAFYETSLLQQKAESAEDAEIFDLLFANRVWDLATVYDFAGSLGYYTETLLKDSNQLASVLESHRSSVEKALSDLRSKF